MKRRERGRSDLRHRAEAKLAAAPPAPGGADVRLLHELQVHQVELELQNEELRTARLEGEALLNRYQELFDFAPIGYFQLGADGRVEQANFAAARLLRVTRGQLSGRQLVTFVARRQWPEFSVFLRQVMKHDGTDEPPEEGEFQLVQEGGEGKEARDVRLTATLLADGGTAAAILVAAEDVTLRRRAERELQAASRRREEFLAALSHELRNPLAPIRNALAILDRAPSATELGLRATEVIKRQVTHLTRIVEDLLEVTRLARGKIQLRRERLDLGVQALRAAEDHRPAFERSRVRLVCRAEPGRYWAEADPSRVAQVLGNLLGNALKFTDSGGEVELDLRRDGPALALIVRDTGVGMTEKVIGNLFEPFSQGPQTLERSSGGLGLGLAMVKGLVELHGGTVQAGSAGPGRGAEFVVRFPAASAPAAAEVAQRPPEISLGAPHRVLVIDDNEDAATTLKDLLELGGHHVQVALDGPAGLEEAGSFRPEVVICDIGLPAMDGYQVARALRANTSTRLAWLIALSGYAGSEDVERARTAGFNRHVAKPLSMERLEGLMAEVPLEAGREAGSDLRSGQPHAR